MAQAFYRKYRPSNFENLIGQDHVKKTLINALTSGQVAHAYMFSGPRGTGKTSTARLVAKAMNCENVKNGFEPCEECEICRDISEGKLMDLIEIDAASNRGIDEIRDLNEKIRFSPTRTKHKIYIIDEVHMMTKEAFNALLKTLEEPPSHAYFILATTEIHKIPETIISRCQCFDFRRVAQEDLVSRLNFIAKEEKIDSEDEALKMIARYSNGGMRDAIGVLEQISTDGKISTVRVMEVLGLSDHSLFRKLYGLLLENKTSEALRLVEEVYSQGSDVRQFTREFIGFLREKMLEEAVKQSSSELSKIVNFIEKFEIAGKQLSNAHIPQLPLEIAVVKLCGNLQNQNVRPQTESQVETQNLTVEAPKAVIENPSPSKPAEPPKKAKLEVEREHRAVTKPSGDVSLGSISSEWKNMVADIKSPQLRMSLKSSTPVSLEGIELTLQFATKFHRDKVMEAENRKLLELSLADKFGVSLKVTSIIHSAPEQFTPEPEPEPQPQPVPHVEPPADAKKENDESVKAVLEVFGLE